MEFVKRFEKRQGVDIGYINDNIHPENGDGCVGKAGINKEFSLPQIIELAYSMKEKPNILIKAGPSAKWYLKKFDTRIIESEIEKQNWRDTSRCTMYIIHWE